MAPPASNSPVMLPTVMGIGFVHTGQTTIMNAIGGSNFPTSNLPAKCTHGYAIHQGPDATVVTTEGLSGDRESDHDVYRHIANAVKASPSGQVDIIILCMSIGTRFGEREQQAIHDLFERVLGSAALNNCVLALTMADNVSVLTDADEMNYLSTSKNANPKFAELLASVGDRVVFVSLPRDDSAMCEKSVQRLRAVISDLRPPAPIRAVDIDEQVSATARRDRQEEDRMQNEAKRAEEQKLQAALDEAQRKAKRDEAFMAQKLAYVKKRQDTAVTLTNHTGHWVHGGRSFFGRNGRGHYSCCGGKEDSKCVPRTYYPMPEWNDSMFVEPASD